MNRRHFLQSATAAAIAQSLPDLPEDWAAQHDHYIHGTAKR